MKVFLNIIWYFPFFGFMFAFFTAIGGLLMCLTVVGLPLGLGLLQIAKFLLAPHTYELVSQKDLSAAKGEERNQLWVIFSTIVRILYFPIGVVLAVIYFFTAILNFVSLIGIPNALVYVKLIPAVFNPVGKVCVGGAIARKLKADKDQAKVDKYFGVETKPNAGQELCQSTQMQNETSHIDNPRFYSDEKIADILDNQTLYRNELVESCRKEKEIRDNIEAVMPEVEAMPMEKIKDIVYSENTYSPVIERCAQIILNKENDRIEAEMAEERRREEAEREAAAEAQRQRRKEQMDTALEFLNKWKFVIGGSVIAIATLSIILWVTSDSHRFNVMVDAIFDDQYDKAIEMATKIDNPDSKYYQPALVLGLNVEKYYPDMGKKSQNNIEVLRKRLNKYVESTEFNEKNFLAHTQYWQGVYDNLDKSLTDSVVNPEWQRLAAALSNAQIPQSSSVKAAVDYSAGYAYFMNREYDKAERFFELAKDTENETIQSFAYGYLGIINLFELNDKPCTRKEAYKMLLNAPMEGVFALYRGNAEITDTDNTLKERLTRAQSCYWNAFIPEESGLYSFAQTCREIVDKLIETSAWNYYGYTYGENRKGKYTGPTKYIGTSEWPAGWGVFQWRGSYSEFGKFSRGANNTINGIPYITFYDTHEWLFMWKTSDSTTIGERVGSTNPKEYPEGMTVFSTIFTIPDMYGLEISPLHNEGKHKKIVESIRERFESEPEEYD